MSTPAARPDVAVLLSPGSVFFEIALPTETLAARCAIRYHTHDGCAHDASNGARIEAAGSYAQLLDATLAAVLIPGGDPRAIVEPECLAAPALRAQGARGALLAGICAGNLVLASAGLLRGRRGTHNYTPEHASPQQVAQTA